MFVYKTDLLAALKSAGYTTYRIRKDRLLGESTLQRIRQGHIVSWAELNTICGLLKCQPGDLIEWVDDERG